jgi:2-keto-4-pentenoate hydratase
MKLLVLLAALAPVFAAEPPSLQTLKSAAADYLAKKPISGIQTGFSLDNAYEAQFVYSKILSEKLGPPAGYKIGLIIKPAQERYGASGPIRGVLLKEMLLPNGAKVSPAFGTRPTVELDIGVLVKDTAINTAQSIPEVAKSLSHLVCFIELVDTVTATNQPLDAALLVALNVGARAGILGEKVPMTQELAEALPNMRLVLQDSEGKTLGEVPKLNLQPLANIPMLAASLKKEGKRLNPGDFISLGSPAAQQPPLPGKTLQLRYENLPTGPLTAKVEFFP